MTERTHTLTEDDIEWLGNHASYGSAVELLAALPSRQPKNPDAGLGAQPWHAKRPVYLGSQILIMEGGVHGLDAGKAIAVVGKAIPSNSQKDPEAVTRAILAAPLAIKLARAIPLYFGDCPQEFDAAIAASGVKCDSPYGSKALCALAAEVLAIADGEA